MLMTEELDVMEVSEAVGEVAPVAGEGNQEFEVVKITSRKETPDGMEHLYEVHWKDGDITFEPVSNLSSASDALRRYLEASHPHDALLKMLSALVESDNEEENGPEKANGVDSKLSFLARWHQKTTRGSTQYWLRKGDDRAEIPSLLKREIIKEIETETPDDAPLMPQSVPDTPDSPEVSAVLFSEGEGTPGTPGMRVRKRIRIVEETVKMFPHEELYDLEQQQNKTIALWQEILSGVLLVGCCLCLFLYLYHTVYRSSASQANPAS